MLKRHKKYFWDYTENASEIFKLARLLEYASFPDLIALPFDFFKKYIFDIQIEKLRTTEKRKMFIEQIKKYAAVSDNWETAIKKSLDF